MISVLVLAAVSLLTLAFQAWVISATARRLGAKRFGPTRALLVILVTVAAVGINALFGVDAPAALAVLLVVIVLGAPFVAIKLAFGLSALRSLATLVAYIATGLANWAVALLLVVVVCEAFRVPTDAMAPTIRNNDRVVVEKRLSPRRWDLVVYRTETDPSQFFCKRLIGLPGENLRFEDGKLLVDGHEVDPPAVLKGRLCSAPAEMPAGERLYAEGQTIPLAGDECFFIGDNVDLSKDSRIMGPSKKPAIIGVIDLIYWPPRHFRMVR